MYQRSSDIFAPISYGLFSIFLWSLSASIADFLTGAVNYLGFTIGILLCGLLFFGVDSYRKRHRFRRRYRALSRKEQYKFLGSIGLFGILLVLYDLTFYFSIQAGPSVPANLINYLWPVLTPIFAVYLFRRPGDEITPYELSALLLAFAGAAIAVWDFSGGATILASEIRISYVAALVAAVSAALYLNALDMAQDYIDSVTLTYFLGLVFALPLLILATFVFELSIQITTDSIPLVVAYGFVGFAGGQLAWGRAITRGNKVVISALAYLTPILSTLFLFVLVDATLTQSMAAGGTLIIVANVLLNDSFRHISSIRGAIIGIFTVSIILFVNPEIGGAEGSIGVFGGFVATIFAILAGFMLDQVWQMNEKENASLISINSRLNRLQSLLDCLAQDEREQVVKQIDDLMVSILNLNYLKDTGDRHSLSRQVYSDINQLEETLAHVFDGMEQEEHAMETSRQLREDVNNWLMLNQEGIGLGEMAILWILGTVTIILFIINTSAYFVQNLIAIALSGVVVFTILKIRDYNHNKTGTEKALVEQDILFKLDKNPYFPSREMVLDAGYIETMNDDEVVRLGDEFEEETVRDLTPHVYVRYSLFALAGLGILLMIVMVYIQSSTLV